MQMKIIALAIAGLVSGAAFAQTNVTVYGSIDIEYLYSNANIYRGPVKDAQGTLLTDGGPNKGFDRTFHGLEQGAGVNGGGSRLGFQGEEALGNGLKALFKLEWGTPVDVGGTNSSCTLRQMQDPPEGSQSCSTGFGVRYSYVGLGGDFGTVTLGRDGTPWDYLGMGNTGVQGINGIEPINIIRARLNTLSEDRWNNSISYRSPKFSGLDFTLMYSFGEQAKIDKDDKISAGNASKWGLGARYANGPVNVVAVYHNQDDLRGKPTKNTGGTDGWASGSCADPGDPDYTYASCATGSKGWALGGSYDFRVVKLYANYMSVKQNLLKDIYPSGSTAAGGNVDRDTKASTAWSVGLGIAAGPNGTVSLEYAAYEDGSLKKYNTANGFGIGYRHNLSKRTYVFTALSTISNDTARTSFNGNTTAVTGPNVGFAATRIASAGTVDSQTNFTLGMRHFF